MQFSLDEEAQKRIESRTSTIADELKRIQKQAGDTGKAINEGFKGAAEGVKQTDEALKKTGKTAEETARQVSTRIRALRSEARAIIADVRLIRDQADDLDRIFKPLAVGGALVTGGILAFANKYVQDAEQATQTTEAWKAAQDDLNRSGQRIGEVLATEALPLIREAAKVTRQIAGFLESHPEVVRGALALGTAGLVVGTLGKAVTSGIRLYADLKLDQAMLLQQTAAQLQLKASENQLAAAGIQARSSGVGTTAAGASRSPSLGTVALYASSVLIGAELGTILGNKIGEVITGGKTGLAGPGKFGIGDAAVGGLLAVQTPMFAFVKGLNELGAVSDQTLKKYRDTLNTVDKFAAGLLGANKILNVFENLSPTKIKDAIERPPSFLGGSKETQDSVVQAFADWQKEDARIVNDAMEQRKQIVADGEKAIADITRNYANERTSISTRFSQEAAQLTTRYQEETRKAELDYAKERVDIVTEGNDRIREIQAEEQEKREEIERNFAKSAGKAAAERDALALVAAQEARDEALAEADRGTSEAITKEKRETAERLQELASRYAQERQQRQAQYEADLKENAARRAAALKEAADRHQTEVKQARELNAQKLKEAAEAANKERIDRRTQFIAQLNDLGVTLNSERQLRNNAYNSWLADTQLWLQQMGASFASATQSASSLGTASGGTAGGSTTTSTNPNFPGLYQTRDTGGYATRGIYRLAWDGKPEWVMSANDTRAAERAIGGQLTQANMAQMIALMAAMRGSNQVVDNSQYGKDMTTRQIRDIKEAQARSLDKLLGRY